MGCNCKDTSVMFKDLDEFINENNHVDETSLIAVLHKAQTIFGYLPRNVQIYVAEQLNVPVAKVYGVITFYSFFTDTPRGEYVIQVCLGTACFVLGADKVMEEFEKEIGIKSGETTEDMRFTLSGVRCVGACGLAPVVIINEKVFGHVKPEDVKDIVKSYYVGQETN
jgi:NADH-quinone oxidoreductase subunit E